MCTRMFTEKRSRVKRGVYTLNVRIFGCYSSLREQQDLHKDTLEGVSR
jgi:hypothetical protein